MDHLLLGFFLKLVNEVDSMMNWFGKILVKRVFCDVRRNLGDFLPFFETGEGFSGVQPAWVAARR